MFGQSLVRASRLGRNVRYFRSNAALRDAKDVSSPGASSASQSSVPSSPKPVDPEQVLGAKMHKCRSFDKWMLVWMKKFPSKEQVPDKISIDLLHKTQSQARVRTANLMIVFTICGCIWAVISGKKEAKAGRTMHQQNEDWHAEINREYKAAALAAQTKTT